MLHKCCFLGPCLAPPELVNSFFYALAKTSHGAKLVTVALISVWLQIFPQLNVDLD